MNCALCKLIVTAFTHFPELSPIMMDGTSLKEVPYLEHLSGLKQLSPKLK